MKKPPRKLILCCPLCPGDIMTMTVAVHSLHETYPGQYLTDVRTPCPDIWQHNPWITPIADNDPEATRIQMEYPQINRSNQTPINFVSCYTEFLGEKLGRPLYARSNRPLIYLTDEEKNWLTMLQEHFTHGRKTPYGVLVAGSKCDYTIKQWPIEYYQEVIDRTLGLFQWVQIGEAGHNHHRLERCISVLGETTHRMLHRLVYHSAIGLGPVTYLMHLCAAFEKPYVYLAGGREPVTFLCYPKMHTLHTIGALPCCQQNACWKSRVVPLGDGDAKDRQLCEHPVIGLTTPVAKCMAMIQPEDVVSIIQRYARLAV
jgi:ADP-heptose:LPS heptosyltransferase